MRSNTLLQKSVTQYDIKTIIYVLLNICFVLFFPLYFYFYEKSLSCAILYSICLITLSLVYGTNNVLYFHFGLLFVIIYLLILTQLHDHHFWGNGFSDDYYYEIFAENYYNDFGMSISNLNSRHRYHNSVGYLYGIVLLFKLGSFFDGYHHLLPIILNVFILQLTAIYMEKICSELYNLTEKKYIIKMYCLYPSVLFLCAYAFRDIAVGLLAVMIFYYAQNRTNYIIYNLSIIGFSLFILHFLRLDAALLLTILASFLYLYRFLKFKNKTVYLLFVLIAIVLAVFLYINRDIFAKILRYNVYRFESGGFIMKKIMSLPVYIGIFPRLSLLSITPMFTLTYEQGIMGISGIIQLFTFPLVCLGIINKKINVQIKVFFLLFFVGVALSTFTFRHITMYLPFGFIISYLYLLNSFKKNIYYNALWIYAFIFVFSFSLLFI